MNLVTFRYFFILLSCLLPESQGAFPLKFLSLDKLPHRTECFNWEEIGSQHEYMYRTVLFSLSCPTVLLIQFQTWLYTSPGLLCLGRTQVEMAALGAHLGTDGWDKSQGEASDKQVPEERLLDIVVSKSQNISLLETSSPGPLHFPGQAKAVRFNAWPIESMQLLVQK